MNKKINETNLIEKIMENNNWWESFVYNCDELLANEAKSYLDGLDKKELLEIVKDWKIKL